MIGYFCEKCQMYYRASELLTGKHCPECKQVTKPRLILAGQVMGNIAEEERYGNRSP